MLLVTGLIEPSNKQLYHATIISIGLHCDTEY